MKLSQSSIIIRAKIKEWEKLIVPRSIVPPDDFAAELQYQSDQNRLAGLEKELRESIMQERELFIEDWCNERGLSSRISDNFDKGAMAWAIKNSPSNPNFK